VKKEHDKSKGHIHSIHAEEAVLHSLIHNNYSWHQISKIVNADDFYIKKNRSIFSAISVLAKKHEKFDYLSLVRWLDELDHIGGSEYLERFRIYKCTFMNEHHILDYAALVHKYSIIRKLYRARYDVHSINCETEECSAVDNINTVNKATDSSSRTHDEPLYFTDMKTLILEKIKNIDDQLCTNNFAGLPTGFRDLDNLISGLQNSNLIVIGGRPFMGKTDFALNIVTNLAVEHKLPVAIISIDTPEKYYVNRLLSSQSNIELFYLHRETVDEDDMPRLTTSMDVLANAPIYIDYTLKLTLEELVDRARYLRNKRGLSLIVIDHLQIIQIADTQEVNAHKTNKIMRGLKELAVELEIPIIVLSQLNRDIEDRTDKRPTLVDLPDCRAIEPAADIIVLIYRDEMYTEDSPDKNVAEINIAKHRNGSIGSVFLFYQEQYAQFRNATVQEDGWIASE